MILFNPKRKRPRSRRAAKKDGSGNPSAHSAPPIQAQSAPHLPLRPFPPLPPDPPPYTFDPPERTPTGTVAPTSTTQPRHSANASRAAASSVQATRDGPRQWQPERPDGLHHRISLCDLISSKLDAVLTSIDGEVFSGDARELGVWCRNTLAVRRSH